jgi:DNA polymerase
LLAAEAELCRACALAEERQRVVFSSGPSDARVMVVGEAPGAEEDARGIPFVGRSGALLGRLLDEVGLAREDLYVTNVVKCRPPANRTPGAGEIAACRHFLVAQLEGVAPRIVITLGNTATRSVLSTTEPIGRLRGRSHAGIVDGATVVPTYHPAAALRGGVRVVEQIREDLRLAAELAKAAP